MDLPFASLINEARIARLACANCSPDSQIRQGIVTVSGTGKIVYTAGQFARDIDGNCVGKGDMRAQMEQTFRTSTGV